MITLYSKDIHCNNCTNRIIKAFSKENIKAEVSLENKTIKVNQEDKQAAIELLDDLGFSSQEK